MEKITLNEITLTLQRAKVVILTDVAYLERSNVFFQACSPTIVINCI